MSELHLADGAADHRMTRAPIKRLVPGMVALSLLAAIAFALLGHPSHAEMVPVQRSEQTDRPSPTESAVEDSDPVGVGVTPSATSAVGSSEMASAVPTTAVRAAAAVAASSAAASSSRLRIPAIGVDAPIETAGPPVNGQLAAPSDADSVVWYGFTAEPGASGNALIAGHVDLGQRTAVFWNLSRVRVGDVVAVQASGSNATYVVDRTYAVPGDTTDTEAIIGTRSGPATLTLITCDGSFVSAKHAYDQRRIVVASLRS